MDYYEEGLSEIPFSVDSDERREYITHSEINNDGDMFVIGANFGPVYHNSYWKYIENVARHCKKLSVRDWSSYKMVHHLENTQYAPDIGFLIPADVIPCGNKVIGISVMDVSSLPNKGKHAQAYYELLADAIKYFLKKEYKIRLIALCNREGDVRAIAKLRAMVNDHSHLLSEHIYSGDIQKTLECFADTDFMICTRFHSMIMGMALDKPIFPILYNCKMQNYLLDTGFKGRSILLDDIEHCTLDDVIYNYQEKTICDCTWHKNNAWRHFDPLLRYLKAQGG